MGQFELDHVMLACPAAQPAVGACQEAGLQVAGPWAMPGTGATQAVVFFDNAYLELVWPSGPDPAFADAPGMHFGERARHARSGWCPFAVAFRPTAPSPAAPIPSWDHAAPFLPPGAVPIPVGANSGRSTEPLLITSLVSRRPDQRADHPPLQHALGLRELTAVRLVLPPAPRSRELATICGLLPLRLIEGDAPWAELIFDGGSLGHRRVLGRGLPITLCW